MLREEKPTEYFLKFEDFELFESCTMPNYLFWNAKWQEVPWPMILQHFDDVIEEVGLQLDLGQIMEWLREEIGNLRANQHQLRMTHPWRHVYM